MDSVKSEPAYSFDRPPSAMLSRINIMLSLLISAMAYTTFGFLLQMYPGGAGIEQPDLVFNIDVHQYVYKLGNLNYQELNTKHLLRMHTWVPLTRMLFPLFDGNLHEQAVKAAVTFNVICLSLSFTCVSWFAFKQLKNMTKVWLLNSIHLLSTSSLIMSAPDHFTQSYLLMILALLVFMMSSQLKTRLPLLILTGVFIAGTTTSNAAFAGLLLYFSLANHFHFRAIINRLIIAGFLLAPVVGGYLFYRYTQDADPNQFLFLKFFNFRLFSDIWGSLNYALASFVYPIVSPLPEISRAGHLTLEPITLGDLNGWYVLPWGLVIAGIGYALFNTKIEFANSAMKTILVAWILFNVIFHNIWGDEYILFAAHYASALLFILIFLFGKLKTSYCLLFAGPIIIWQCVFAYSTLALIG